MAGTNTTTTEAGIGAAAGSPPRRSRRRRLLVLGVAAAMLAAAAGSAAVYVLGIFAPPSIPGSDAADGSDDGRLSAQPRPAPVLYDLPEFIVNLNVQGRKTRFLKLRSRLELAEPTDVPIVDRAMPRIVDAFQVYLREMRPEDLEGSAGTYRLREALVRRVGAEVGPQRVGDLLFVELFVQ